MIKNGLQQEGRSDQVLNPRPVGIRGGKYWPGDDDKSFAASWAGNGISPCPPTVARPKSLPMASLEQQYNGQA
jgi:hypothetical protein